jgi:PiT family inorganic phosphate transporter
VAILDAIGLIAIIALAASNGANDNFKGVATLWGSGTLSYRSALGWATATVLVGSLVSVGTGAALAARFSGKGLVDARLVGDPRLLIAVACAAALTVLAASRFGLPVSTTHALIGALIGASVAAGGVGTIHAGALGRSFLLPLVASPLLAGVTAGVVWPGLRRLRRSTGLQEDSCICVAEGPVAVSMLAQSIGAGPAVGTLPSVVVGTEAECERTERLASVRVTRLLDGSHMLSGGAVGFARGLNDTPKVAALLLAVPALRSGAGLAIVAGAMAIGGILGASRVARRISWDITPMNAGQATVASTVTAILVTAATFGGLPVSTTHVSCGALFGLGVSAGTARAKTIRTIVLAWIVTLPVALVLGLASGALLATWSRP